ncbi:hypothetical protein B0T16DRAFT_63272 [Cercophora newfieldiana]|uniref:Uncharacterized protein n=1 Tax=Cercophora newfieldiana TaxID=92897 RepID=A0AA39YRZ6_9PEZI|nr:hypothetical protein B0T16DRAFT_63272 [Cercophora newfieldiana]
MEGKEQGDLSLRVQHARCMHQQWPAGRLTRRRSASRRRRWAMLLADTRTQHTQGMYLVDSGELAETPGPGRLRSSLALGSKLSGPAHLKGPITAGPLETCKLIASPTPPAHADQARQPVSFWNRCSSYLPPSTTSSAFAPSFVFARRAIQGLGPANRTPTPTPHHSQRAVSLGTRGPTIVVHPSSSSALVHARAFVECSDSAHGTATNKKKRIEHCIRHHGHVVVVVVELGGAQGRRINTLGGPSTTQLISDTSPWSPVLLPPVAPFLTCCGVSAKPPSPHLQTLNLIRYHCVGIAPLKARGFIKSPSSSPPSHPSRQDIAQSDSCRSARESHSCWIWRDFVDLISTRCSFPGMDKLLVIRRRLALGPPGSRKSNSGQSGPPFLVGTPLLSLSSLGGLFPGPEQRISPVSVRGAVPVAAKPPLVNSQSWVAARASLPGHNPP